MIRETYQITEQTIALCPAKEMDHDTIVLEQAATYRVRKTPMQLIKEACIANWSTYEGKRQAVIHHTKFRKKVPIPINLEKNIFTFPTHATSDFDCHWIFFHHIAHIHKQQNQTVITFKNNKQLPLPLSHYIFKKQYERTLSCMIEVKGIYR
ncbi:competence protein ComK [Virgibacillus oceani]